MIDWLWLRLPVAAHSRLPVGRVLSLTAEGEVEWQAPKWFQTRGSHESTLGVKLDGRGDLHISGSPAKFFQGHNLFGSDDVKGLADAMISRVFDQCDGLVQDERTALSLEHGLVDVLRIDINSSYSTGSRERCHAWLRAAAESCTMKHRGRALLDRETLYLGRRSRYFTIKGYCKGHELEMKDRRLPEALRTPEMLAYADDALRMELQINARGLRRLNRELLCNWKLGDPVELYSEHLARVSFAGNLRMTPTEIESLPRELRKTYELWQAGLDLKTFKAISRPTYYRHRLQLLQFGVDIASLRPQSNVVRLVTTIEATPKGIPAFALNTPLYFEPRRRSA